MVSPLSFPLFLFSLSSSLIFPSLQAERDRLEREKQARLEAEQRQLELEERLRRTEDEVRKAIHARLQTEEALKMMQEQVT